MRRELGIWLMNATGHLLSNPRVIYHVRNHVANSCNKTICLGAKCHQAGPPPNARAILSVARHLVLVKAANIHNRSAVSDTGPSSSSTNSNGTWISSWYLAQQVEGNDRQVLDQPRESFRRSRFPSLFLHGNFPSAGLFSILTTRYLQQLTRNVVWRCLFCFSSIQQ